MILSYRTWKTVFGSDPSIINRSVLFNQQSYKVVGVMRPEFEWPAATDLWSPLGLAPDAFDEGNTFNENYFSVARLQPGVTPAQSAALMNVITQRFVARWPSEFPKSAAWGVFSVPFTELVYGDVRTPAARAARRRRTRAADRLRECRRPCCSPAPPHANVNSLCAPRSAPRRCAWRGKFSRKAWYSPESA